MEKYYYHDPQCEVFPTEVKFEYCKVIYIIRLLQVACTFRAGATTGGIDRSNFLCILGNNLFNQKYFLFLWMWWIFLLVVSLAGAVYRVLYTMMPSFARWTLIHCVYNFFVYILRFRLLRRIHYNGVDDFNTYKFTTSHCFVLDLILDNIRDLGVKREV